MNDRDKAQQADQDRYLASLLEGRALREPSENEKAEKIILRLYRGEEITDAERRVGAKLRKNRSALNIRTRGLLIGILDGEISIEELYPLIGKSSAEFGSGIYDCWSFCMIAACLQAAPGDEVVKTYLRGVMAAHSLLVVPVGKIALTGPRGRSERAVSKGHLSDGDLSVVPMRRSVWEAWVVQVFKEMDLIAGFARQAAGKPPKWRKIHRVHSWAFEIARRHIPAMGDSGAELVGYLNRLPLGHGRAVHFVETSSHVLSLMEHIPGMTRGPVPVAWAEKGAGVLECVSPSKPLEHGRWTGATSGLGDDDWTWWTEDRVIDPMITGTLPGRLLSFVTWDGAGARQLVGGAAPPAPPPAPPPATPGPGDPRPGEQTADFATVDAAMRTLSLVVRDLERKGATGRRDDVAKFGRLARRSALGGDP